MSDTQKDLEHIAAMLDRIVSSEDPDVRRSFEELLIVVSLKQRKVSTTGVFTNLIKRVNELESEVKRIKNAASAINTYKSEYELQRLKRTKDVWGCWQDEKEQVENEKYDNSAYYSKYMNETTDRLINIVKGKDSI
jgi:hypothetical protein